MLSQIVIFCWWAASQLRVFDSAARPQRVSRQMQRSSVQQILDEFPQVQVLFGSGVSEEILNDQIFFNLLQHCES